MRGEWAYDLTLEAPGELPGSRRLAARRPGRASQPCIAASTSVRPCSRSAPQRARCRQAWSEEATQTDIVLDVKQIAKWSHQLGPNVTVIRVNDAMHDVYCSRKDVRDEAFAQTKRWLDYAL